MELIIAVFDFFKLHWAEVATISAQLRDVLIAVWGLALLLSQVIKPFFPVFAQRAQTKLLFKN